MRARRRRPGQAAGAADGRPKTWISTAQLTIDSVALAESLPHDAARIVGLPRSGMIPATVAATHLNLPLCQLLGDGTIQPLERGSRGFSNRNGRTVVIDDSVHGGFQMNRVRGQLGDSAIYAAVYVRPDSVRLVDHYVRTLEQGNHLFEWNYFNNVHLLKTSAFDFDGILCHDPAFADADEGPLNDRYRQWLADARPRWVVRSHAIKMIVTARLERFRPATEAWLSKWGIACERLVMHPALSVSDRGDVGAWKGTLFRNSSLACFVESDLRQAEVIRQVSGKQVICPPAGKVLS